MSLPQRPKERKFQEAPPFVYHNYETIDEAEARSGNIGFPIFSCQWLDDGSILFGGGGGSRGRDVRSALLTARLVDGVAVECFLPHQALIDPLSIGSAQAPLPSMPLVQAVGEITTADSIVSAISNCTSVSPGFSVIGAGVGACAAVFEIKGFGTLASSQLPPCRDLNTQQANLDFYQVQQAENFRKFPNGAATFTKPTLPFSTPFKSPLLSHSLSLSSNATLNGNNIPLNPSSILPNQPTTQSKTITNLPSNQSALPTPGLTNTSSLAQVINQLTREGKRTLSPKVRFRCDFSPRDSYVSTLRFLRDGQICITGGDDGIVRAWWVSDPNLMTTYVTHGVRQGSNSNDDNEGGIINDQSNNNNDDGNSGWLSNHKKSNVFQPQEPSSSSSTTTSSTRTKFLAVPLTPQHPSHSSLHQPRLDQHGSPITNNVPNTIGPNGIDYSAMLALGYVSPLFLPVADAGGGIKEMDISHDERILSLVGDDGAISLWNIPTVDEIRANGVRIPIDYLDENGNVLSYPGPKDKTLPTDPDMSLSLETSMTGVDRLVPICTVPTHPSLSYARSLFWTPPTVTHVVPQTTNTNHMGMSTLAQMDDNNNDNDDDDEFDEALVRPHNLPELINNFNSHPSRSIKDYILLSLAVETKGFTWLIKHVVSKDEKTGKQTIRVSSQMKVFENSSGAHMVISPNRHFVAIIGTDIHIYTTLDAPYIRTLQLMALNQSYSYRLSLLGPLDLVCKKLNPFSLPCTSVVFDPSSRLLITGSADRSINWLQVKPQPRIPACNSQLLCCQKWCCPLYYLACFHVCCSPRKLKPHQLPPRKQSSCEKKFRTRCATFGYYILFGWFFHLLSTIKNRLCSRRPDITLPTANNEQSTIVSNSGLTLVNLIFFSLVVVFLSQFMAEFGQ